jgi:hypothetical protein
MQNLRTNQNGCTVAWPATVSSPLHISLYRPIAMHVASAVHLPPNDSLARFIDIAGDICYDYLVNIEG